MPHPSPSSERSVTLLVATLDPPFSGPFPSRLRELVEAAGGRLERAPSAELDAAFGSTQSDEEAPARAVRAAIALHREISSISGLGGAPLSLRIGVHTGDIHWPLPGEDRLATLRDALAHARLLAAQAEPGRVLASAATERAANARIRFRKTSADDVFEAVGEIETGRSLREDLRTPTVGRDVELAKLAETFAKGHGGFVLVEGDAGVGKSRLIYEFRRRLSEKGTLALVGTGRAYEGPQGPLGVFGDLVRAAAGVTGLEKGDGERVATWILGHLEVAVTDAIEGENCAHLIALSIGLPLPETRVTQIEPARMKSETQFAWVRWLRALAAKQPVVLCLEDLHWADDATLSLLDALAAGLSGERVMFLATRRPSARTPRGCERVRLAELPREAGLKLAEAIVKAPLSEELAEFLSQQSGGHPYYLEELARYLVEEGLVTGKPARLVGRPDRLPDGLHGLLVARINSLGHEDREVLKAASVFGRVFWTGLLERALYCRVERTLDRARRRQIVVSHAQSLIPGEPELAFRHALLRDAAYSLLTPRDRARLHRVVADLLQTHVESGGRRVRSLVASHREAAGQREEPARLWQEAAREALRDSAWAEALGHARDALRLGHGPAAHMIAGRALVRLARLDEALAEAKTVTESPDASAEEIASAKLLQAEIHGRRGDQERFLSLVEEVASAHPPGLVLIEALVRKARVLWGLGRYDPALQCIEEVRTRLGDVPSAAADRETARLLSDAHGVRGLILWKQGHPREAAAAYERALEIARTAGDRFAIAAALNSMGALHRDLREDGRARAVFEEAIGILREIGDRTGIAGALTNLGLVLRESGALTEAAAAHREALTILRQSGDALSVARGLKSLSDALIDAGEYGAALEALEEALGIAKGVGDRSAVMLVLRNLGQAHAALAEDGRAEGELKSALEMAREAGSAFNEAFVLLRLSEIQAASGRGAEALESSAQAVHVTETHRMPELHAEALLARARLRADALLEGALSDAQAAVAAAVAAGSKAHEGAALSLLARLEGVAGSKESARENLRKAAELAPHCRVLHERFRLMEDTVLARVAIGDVDAARTALDAAVELAKERRARAAGRRLEGIRGRMQIPV